MRLFVAIGLPAAARHEIGERVGSVRPRLPPARWVRLENLHLSLLFLGEVTGGAADRLRESLEHALGGEAGFALALHGGGTFPARRPGRVAWVGVEAPEAISALQSRVAAAAGAVLGAAGDGRQYHPHVTVARPRRPWPRTANAAWAETLVGPLGEPFTVGEATLFRSALGPGGARYTALARFALGGAT